MILKKLRFLAHRLITVSICIPPIGFPQIQSAQLFTHSLLCIVVLSTFIISLTEWKMSLITPILKNRFPLWPLKLPPYIVNTHMLQNSWKPDFCGLDWIFKWSWINKYNNILYVLFRKCSLLQTSWQNSTTQSLVINIGTCFARSYVFLADDLSYGNVFLELRSRKTLP